MAEDPQVIRLTDVAKGLLATIPDSLAVPKGVFNLLRTHGDQTRSIGSVLERHARRSPQRQALLFEDRSWTYAEFNAWANRIAHVFRDHGVGSGDSVAILMENRPEVLACVAACVKLGAVAGMLNHNQREEVLSHSIQLTKARLLVVGQECVAALKSTKRTPHKRRKSKLNADLLWDGAGDAPFGYGNLRAQAARASQQNLRQTRQVRASQPAFYIFTSGTTGMPKASVMSHLRWLRGMAGMGQAALRLRASDVFYCSLPLYHNNALTVSWGAVLGAGATLALGRKFSASRFWDEIRGYGATSFCYIGELCRYLLNQPPSHKDRDHRVRVMVGNGLRPEIWDAFQERFGISRIAEFYGASESNAAFVNGLGLKKTAGFCPMSFAIVEFDADNETPLRDARGFMRKVGKGGVGLLITRVNDRTPFDGYTDAEASAKKLFHNVFKAGDCWFNSGDLVRDQGFRHIAFVDRVGDTFRWKGENVATTQVEAALNAHPKVEQAVVYGVQLPGTDGRAGMASLSWAEQSVDGKALADFLQNRLPAYAVPLFLRLREEQEVTGTFKFKKTDLKKAGFDPAQISEPLYALLDKKRGYQPLDQALFERICSGEVRI